MVRVHLGDVPLKDCDDDGRAAVLRLLNRGDPETDSPRPYCSLTEATLNRLAALQPKRLATMHGSVYVGDGSTALRDLTVMWREVLTT